MSVNPEDIHEAAKKAVQATDYLDVLYRIGPIIAIGGIVAMITHLHQIVEQKTWLRRIFTALSVVGVGCVAGGIVVLALPLFWPNPSAEVDILASAVAGSAGQKGFDVIMEKIFHRVTVE